MGRRTGSEYKFTETASPTRLSENKPNWQTAVCQKCEGNYGRGGFVEGTHFKSDLRK